MPAPAVPADAGTAKAQNDPQPAIRLFDEDSFEETPCTEKPRAAKVVAAEYGVANAADGESVGAELLDAQPESDAESSSEDLFADEISSLKALSFFRSAALEDEDEDSLEEGEPTLHTRSMADVLAEQGDIVGALEIYQELEAAAPTPEEAKVLHDCVVALADRVSAGEALPAEDEYTLSASLVPQNRLMSLLESLADRLEARARA